MQNGIWVVLDIPSRRFISSWKAGISRDHHWPKVHPPLEWGPAEWGQFWWYQWWYRWQQWLKRLYPGMPWGPPCPWGPYGPWGPY